MFSEEDLVVKWLALVVALWKKDFKISTPSPYKSKDGKILMNLWTNILQVKSSMIINVIAAKINVMLPRDLFLKKLPVTLLYIYRECASTMIDYKMKKLILDGNSLKSLMYMTTLLQNTKEYLKPIINSLTNFEESCFTMGQPILATISVILSKVITNGYNSMIKEWDSLIQVILKFNVLEENIGEDRVKVLIYWFTKDNTNLM